MDFTLSPEQMAFSDAVARWSVEHFDLDAVRIRCGGDGWRAGVDELWAAATALDWLRLCIPEDFDGVGGGWLDACVLARAVGAALLPGPIASTVVAARAIEAWGSEDQRGKLLPRVAEGGLRVGLAVGVSNGAAAPERIRVHVDAAGSLRGDLGVVDSFEALDLLVVAARDPSGAIELVLVDATDAGVVAHATSALDATTRAALVTLDGATGEPLPGAGRAEWELLARAAAVVTAAELVGLAGRALDLTVEYDKVRVQFGRPVGSFQAVKHRLAEIHVHVTMAEHGWRYAAHALDVGLPDAALMSGVAKAKASDVARDASAAMIQFHGGTGFVWDHPAHLFFKRAKRMELLFGNADWHREDVTVRLLAERERPGA